MTDAELEDEIQGLLAGETGRINRMYLLACLIDLYSSRLGRIADWLQERGYTTEAAGDRAKAAMGHAKYAEVRRKVDEALTANGKLTE